VAIRQIGLRGGYEETKKKNLPPANETEGDQLVAIVLEEKN
jgi:hypothetical protein